MWFSGVLLAVIDTWCLDWVLSLYSIFRFQKHIWYWDMISSVIPSESTVCMCRKTCPAHNRTIFMSCEMYFFLLIVPGNILNLERGDIWQLSEQFLEWLQHFQGSKSKQDLRVKKLPVTIANNLLWWWRKGK